MFIFCFLFFFSAFCDAKFLANQKSKNEIYRCFNIAESCEMGVPAWRLGRDNTCELFFACPTTDNIDQLFLVKTECEQTCLKVAADVMPTIMKVKKDNLFSERLSD